MHKKEKGRHLICVDTFPLYTLQQLLAGHRDEEFLHTTHLPDSQCLVPCQVCTKICLGVNEWSETVLCTSLTSLGTLISTLKFLTW